MKKFFLILGALLAFTACQAQYVVNGRLQIKSGTGLNSVIGGSDTIYYGWDAHKFAFFDKDTNKILEFGLADTAKFYSNLKFSTAYTDGTIYWPGSGNSYIRGNTLYFVNSTDFLQAIPTQIKISSSTHDYATLNSYRLQLNRAASTFFQVDTNGVLMYGTDYAVRDEQGNRYLKHTYSDSSTTIFNKLIIESPTDTAAIFNGNIKVDTLFYSAISPEITGAGWSLTGNAGTNPTANFIGTTDAQPLVFKVNNTKAGYIGYDVSTDNNLFLGTHAGDSITTGLRNVFIGYLAGENDSTGYENVCIGTSTGRSISSGGSNTLVGYSAGLNLTTGGDNVMIGADAGLSTTTAGSCIFIGTFAGHNNIDGSNIFIGQSSGYNNTHGYGNLAIGATSLSQNLTGVFNVCLGVLAGEYVKSSGNVMVGVASGNLTTSGGSNTMVGYYAGEGNTIGENNVYLGSNAGRTNSSGNSNVAIGNYAGYYETGSNKLYIDNSSTKNPLIFGDFAADSLKTSSVFGISSNLKTRETTLDHWETSQPIADEDSLLIPAGVYGWGTVAVYNSGTEVEFTQIRFSADGTVTIFNNTTNVVTTNTDANLCIYDVGTGFCIKNRLGSTLHLNVQLSLKKL